MDYSKNSTVKSQSYVRFLDFLRALRYDKLDF